MIPARNGADVLSAREKATIHRNVLRILAEIGMQIEHDGMLGRLADAGYPVDRARQRVRFPTDRVHDYLERCPKTDWAARTPVLVANAEVFASRYLKPGTDRLEAWTRGRLESYAAFLRQLPEVENLTLLGCPYRVQAALHPLYERLIAWQFGFQPGGSVHPLSSSEALWDLVQTYAALKGKPVKEVFNGVCFMISPLRLAAEECRQFWFWHQKGLPLSLGDMPTAGSSAPATLAGLVALQLAERLALLIIQREFHGVAHGYISTGMGVSDMKTMIRPFGRPELPIANAMMASMARFYRLGVFGHSGLTDAKLPSQEAGVQKCASTLATLLSGADAFLSIGVLSLDEVISPVQALLDCECVRMLRRYLKEVTVDDEAIGFDTIREVGPGGSFIATEHTLMHFRAEFWEPQLWQRDMLARWQQADRTSDAERALQQYREMTATSKPAKVLTEEEERELLKIIRRTKPG